jgi:uncharacterized delta-60 repeat protein
VRAIAGAALAIAASLLIPSASRATARDLDHHFGGSGKVITDVGQNDSAAAVAVDPSGRLVVAGTTRNGATADFLVARYMPNGSLDSSFGNGGLVTTDFKGRDDTASAMELDSQGRIVVAGTSLGNGIVAAVARYQPDGDPDSSFSGDGKTLTNLGTYESNVNAMAIDAQGRIVVAGRRYLYHDTFDYFDFVLARFMANGALDPSFGGDGKVSTNFQYTLDTARAVAIDAQGRIVAAGQADDYGESSDYALARYTPNGNLDPSFGGNGMIETSFSNDPYDSFWDYATAVVIDGQGRVIAAGGDGETGRDFTLARYDTGGQLSSGFGTGGRVETPFSRYAHANALAIDRHHRVVAVGQDVSAASGRFALARYLGSGELDPSFGSGGKVTTPFGRENDARAYAAAIDPRGRIVAVGVVSNAAATKSDLALARYTGRDGTPPDVTIKGRKKVRTRHHRASARFRFKASEPARFRCKLDGREFRKCSSPYRTPRLAVGRHRIKVRATDEAGNVGIDQKRFRIKRKR